MNKPDDTKPVSVRLCELKKPLEQEAYEREWSLHYLIKKILRSHIDKRLSELKVIEFKKKVK